MPFCSYWWKRSKTNPDTHVLAKSSGCYYLSNYISQRQFLIRNITRRSLLATNGLPFECTIKKTIDYRDNYSFLSACKNILYFNSLWQLIISYIYVGYMLHTSVNLVLWLVFFMKKLIKVQIFTDGKRHQTKQQMNSLHDQWLW